MKGIVLAGGSGTRLYPITKGVSKQLLPIYDKPMIYYPLSVLMLAGIKDILIITTADDQSSFKHLLGDGRDFGIALSYEIQTFPKGIAEAFVIAETFIADDSVCLILGDNFFWGQGFSPMLQRASSKMKGATIFGYQVNDPERFGIVEFNKQMKVLSIEEKPQKAKSNVAITGLYFYDNQVIEFAKKVIPSARGELEITDINQMYLDKCLLSLELLGRGFAWLDTGTHETLLDASVFVETIERRQGYKIACLEEIAFKNGWLSQQEIKEIAEPMLKNSYGRYLLNLIKEDE